MEQNNTSNSQVNQLQKDFPKSSLYAELKQNILTKVDNALWLASHCWTDSRREDYIKELDKHFNVSVIGACAKVEHLLTAGL